MANKMHLQIAQRELRELRSDIIDARVLPMSIPALASIHFALAHLQHAELQLARLLVEKAQNGTEK